MGLASGFQLSALWQKGCKTIICKQFENFQTPLLDQKKIWPFCPVNPCLPSIQLKNKTYKVQLSNPDCLGKRRSWSRSACDWCKRAACERQCCVSSLARRNGFCQVWRRSSQALHTRNCQGGSMSMFKHLLGRVLRIHTYIHTYYINDIYIHFNPSKLRIPHLIITDFKPSTCGSVQEDAKRQWCSS